MRGNSVDHRLGRFPHRLDRGAGSFCEVALVMLKIPFLWVPANYDRHLLAVVQNSI